MLQHDPWPEGQLRLQASEEGLGVAWLHFAVSNAAWRKSMVACSAGGLCENEPRLCDS